MIVNFNNFYNFYENEYKKLSKKFTNDYASSLLNDAVLYSYLNTFNIEIKDNKIYKYDKFIFDLKDVNPFSNKNSFKSKEFTNICLDFKNKFFNKNISFDDLENVFGHVSEKHINRKNTGSYYTPDDTTNFMTQKSILSYLLKEKINDDNIFFNDFINKKNDKIIKMIKNNTEYLNIVRNNIKKLKIIDPTCGSGAFILKTFEFIFYLNSQLNLGLTIKDILNFLYGLDISCEAICLLKELLFLKMIKYQDDSLNDFNFNDFFKEHFILADALIGKDYVIENGKGFDWTKFNTKFNVIIGNPPYVESKYININSNFISYKCGNLYANVIERALNIVSDSGIMSFIVPLPFIATKRMKLIRDLLEKNSSDIVYLSFADRPGCLFNGVHQRLVIFFAYINKKHDVTHIYTSGYNYWYNYEREKLFNNIKVVRNNFSDRPKVGNLLETKIYNKMANGDTSLFDLVVSKETDFDCYMSSRIGLWSKCFLKGISTNEFKKINFDNKKDLILFDAILNSSTFYVYWIFTSDCWHVINENLKHLYFNSSKVTDNVILNLENLIKDLELDLEKNKKYIGSKQVQYEYKHKLSKNIIDRIDDELAIIFGFTKKEVEYIKKFKLKYRMNNAMECD